MTKVGRVVNWLVKEDGCLGIMWVGLLLLSLLGLGASIADEFHQCPTVCPDIREHVW